jgi:hypothetical protein
MHDEKGIGNVIASISQLFGQVLLVLTQLILLPQNLIVAIITPDGEGPFEGLL